jgi:bifunctional UDP-N-acetylglucosamine pyrophosphorylase/glucosamine-1-phosphate N-acetyltransferase
MAQDITLIVLAAGEGKRFWPFTTSKALFPFFGLPLFAHTIADAPVSKMIIVTNPANDAIIRSYHFPIPTSTVIQKEARGMGDAMLACRGAISEDPILIVNVDDVIDPELLSQIAKSDTFGAISGLKKQGPFGYIKFEGNRPVGIVEKPKSGEKPGPYAYLVCDYIQNGVEFLNEIAGTDSDSDDIFEKALTNLMTRHEFTFIPYDGPFAPLKYPWHVLDVMRVLLESLDSHKGKNVEVKSNVIIEGPVYIEDNVKIFENTKIVGPVYIGENSVIGNNSIIRSSHIGRDSVIGFNCDITRSYLGDNCWLHSNYVGDSVLEGNVSMGSGASLANLRFDDGEISGTERNKLGAMVARGVRIGVNASIMPGVKIGKNSFIGSGVVLDRDVPEDSFCIAKPGYTILKNKKTAPTSRSEFRNKI